MAAGLPQKIIKSATLMQKGNKAKSSQPYHLNCCATFRFIQLCLDSLEMLFQPSTLFLIEILFSIPKSGNIMAKNNIATIESGA